MADTLISAGTDTLNLTRAIVYFMTSSLGKLPLVYLIMLLWSGLVLGFTGQAFMFLTYFVSMAIGYGVIRPLIAATVTTPGTFAFNSFYSLLPGLQTPSDKQLDFLSVFMGIPSSVMKNLMPTKGAEPSFLSRYLLLGLPDAMIFPSAFLYGYGAATAQNGTTDSRNMPSLFLLILAILLQTNVSQMSFVTAFLNVCVGIFVGILSGSFVSNDPNLGPFSLQNQQFKVIVQNTQ